MRLRHIILFLLMAVFVTPIRAGISTDYLLGGALTLKNGRIDKYQFEEGYCQAEKYPYNTRQDNFTFCYYDKDHLGNIRQVREVDGTKDGWLLQKMDYYPFGAQFCENSTANDVQPYKYNGKELDKMHGLNTYDYGARQYNPVTGRWDRMDRFAEKYYSHSPYTYCAGDPLNNIDINGDSLKMDNQSIRAVYNGLAEGSHVQMRFNNGILDPSSISDAAKNTDDTFLQDLYEIAVNSQMVELKVTDKNEYIENGIETSKTWNAPMDFNIEKSFSGPALEQCLRLGYQKGTTITGNLGQTLYPIQYGEYKSSRNGNIQILINSKGTLNHQSVGIAHEFAHVTLFLRGLPHSHSKNGDYIYNRQFNVMKRLGYDYIDR